MILRSDSKVLDHLQ